MPRIVRRPKALEDATEIWVYIAMEAGIERANAVIERIDRKIAMLAQYPCSGKQRDELHPELRSAPVARYLIFYFSLKDGVEIVRIVYGGRDLYTIDFDAEDEE